MSRGNFATALAVMTGAGLLGGMPGQAAADQIVQGPTFFSVGTSVASTSDTGTTTASNSTSVGFTGFDTSLGTLTQVEVQLTNEQPGGFMSVNGPEGGVASQSDSFLILDPTLLVANALMSASGVGTGANTAHCSVPAGTAPGCSALKAVPVVGFTPGTTVDLTAPGELSLFEGPTVDLGAEIDSTFTDTCTDIGNTGVVCTFGNNARFSGDLSVTYTYTPNAVDVSVPEPPSWTLYGMAFAALGLMARRRDSRARAG